MNHRQFQNVFIIALKRVAYFVILFYFKEFSLYIMKSLKSLNSMNSSVPQIRNKGGVDEI